jgi:hypothetical protein
MGSDLYWYPLGTDKVLIDVQDGAAVLVEGVDYELAEHTESMVIDLLKNGANKSLLEILVDGVTLIENVDYWIMSGVDQILIVHDQGVDADITIEFELDELVVDVDYTIGYPKSQVASLTASSFYVAIPMISMVQTTDLLSNMESGGGGNRGKIHEVDCFVVNSVGGEISGNNGKEWEELKQTLKTVVAGERIPEVTGKIEARLQQGYNHKDDLTLLFRNQTPYNQIVAAFGIKLQGMSK